MGGVVLPGDVIAESVVGIMCGTGAMERDGQAIATVRGRVVRINQLLMVEPLVAIYAPQVGDVVVGRVTAVQQQRWKIDIGGAVDANFRLTSMLLPDDELRRRTTADERNMRNYLDIHDLLCCEVQEIKGQQVYVHARAHFPRRLDAGVVVEVPARLVRRTDKHIERVEFDGSEFLIVWGMNGRIWLEPPRTGVKLLPRVRNCLLLLVERRELLWRESIVSAFDQTRSIECSAILLT